MTAEELIKLRDVDVTNVDRDTLVDLQDIRIPYAEVSPAFRDAVSQILGDHLSILRSENDLNRALEELYSLQSKASNPAEKRLLDLAKATVECALFRKESRGAHRRTDYPDTKTDCQKQTIVKNTKVFYREINQL